MSETEPLAPEAELGEGYRGAQRFLVTGFSLYRAWAGAIFFVVLAVRPHEYGSPLGAYIVLTAWAGWSIWLCATLRHRSAFDSTPMLAADLIVLALVWAASVWVKPPLPPAPIYVTGVGFCVVLGFGVRRRSVLISMIGGVVLGIGVIWSLVLAGHTLAASTGAVAADSFVAMVALSVGAALLARQVVRTGTQLDAALTASAVAARELAERREQNRAARDLHDWVLQTLESVARSLGVGDGDLRARTSEEAGRMRRMLTKQLNDPFAETPPAPATIEGSIAAERSLYHGFLLFRSATLLWPVFVVPLTLGALARPFVTGTAALACVVESAIVLRIGWRRGSWADPRLAAGDLGFQCLLLAACIWHPETTGDVLIVPFVVPIVMGSMLGCGIAFTRARTVALAGAAAGALYLGLLALRASSVDLLLPLVNSVYWFIGYGLGGWILARELRATGRRTDEARAGAVEAAVLSGRERERERLAASLSERVLPTLERLASDTATSEEIRTDAMRASTWIQGYMQGSAGSDRAALIASLREVIMEFEMHGLGVDLNVAEVWSREVETIDSAVVAASAGAVRAALGNVWKHSGTDHAVVRVASAGLSIVITIVDNGRGFNTADVTGLGIEHSIVGRIDEVGGAVQIDSGPGRGTRIELLLPGGSMAGSINED